MAKRGHSESGFGWAYGKRYCREIILGHQAIRIFGDTIAEIDEQDKWKVFDSRLLESVPIGDVNTWTAYTIFGTERVGSSEVAYLEEVNDGRIHAALNRIAQICYRFCVYRKTQE